MLYLQYPNKTLGLRKGLLQLAMGLTLTGILALGMSYPIRAQEVLREGKLQFVMLQQMADNDFSVISQGFLADLETDPNFDGDFQTIYNAAATILDNYTPVVRGGYFPENAGIPREQQVTVDEAVYRLFQLDNGSELMLYRSPQENTSRYFIRQN